MRRLLFSLLLLLPAAAGAAAGAQEKQPDPAKQPAQALGGSTEKATLALNPLGHVGAINGVFFTRDGKQLMSVGADKSVQFWDVGSGERGKVLRLPAVPTAAALSPDGKTLALGRWDKPGEKRVLLLNLDNERILWLSGRDDRAGSVSALAFSSNGDQLAGGRVGSGADADGAYLWDGLKGIWQKTPQEAAGMQGRRVSGVSNIRKIVFSPDNKRLALGCNPMGAPRTAYLTDLPMGDAKPAPALALAIWSRIMAIAWTPDGKEVVTVDHNFSPVSAVKFWSAADGKLTRQYKLGWLDGAGLHFLNAQQLLLTWYNDGSDRKSGGLPGLGHGQSILTLMDPIKEHRGPYLLGAPHAGGGHSALAADGKLAAFTGGNTMDEIVLWEPATGKQLHHLGGKLGTPQSVGWSKDGKSLGFNALQDKDKKPFFQSALDLHSLQLRQKVDRSDYLYRYRTNGDWFLKPAKEGFQALMHRDKLVRGNIGLGWLYSSGGLPVYIAGTLSPAKEPTWVAYRMGGLELADLHTGKHVQTLLPNPQHIFDLAPSPDGRYLISVNNQQVAFIYRIADEPAKTDRAPLLYLFLSHNDWIMWTQEGYYAASPGGEKLMGWTVENGPDKLPTFHPADRFRKRLYRPDVIKLLIDKGSVAEALKAADAALAQQTHNVKLDDLLPPRAVLSVVDQSRLPIVTLKVQAEAASKEQPITSLRLMMDGRVMPGNQTLVEYRAGKQKVDDVEWTIELPEGEHQLLVLARCPDSSGVSKPIRLKHLAQHKLPALHVLSAGINNYKDSSLDLKYAAPDAETLAAAFAKYCKGQPFREVTTTTLLNAQGTSAAIVKEVTALRKRVNQQDLVVVFFACHGIKYKKDYYLLTHETDMDNLAETALSGDALRKSLTGFKCQVLLILDACHSAGFGEGKKLAKLGLKAASDDVARDLTDDDYGVAVLCAAMSHEKAEGVGGHGLFTRAFLDALEKKPGVPYNHRNQRVYVHHLYSYVFDEVTARSNDRQHPFLSLPWVVESFVVR